MARLFLLLGSPDRIARLAIGARAAVAETDALVAGLTRIRDAMAAYPHLVGGTGRPDSEVIVATGGRVLTKIGAEGVWCGVDRERGLAWAFKVEDGASRAVFPAALEVLSAENVLTPAESARLSALREPELYNHAGRVVGKIAASLA